MRNLWAVYPELLDWETCNEIVACAQKIRPQDAVISDKKIVDANIRSSTVRWVNHNNEDFKEVWSFIEQKFKEANASYFGADISYLPSLQFTTYHENQNGHYDWHVDIFWESLNIMDRKLSMVIQLSDPNDYQGGDLEFKDLNTYPNPQEYRKRGSVIIFPSFVYHRVTPVTKGVRHSLVSWIQGPAWR